MALYYCNTKCLLFPSTVWTLETYLSQVSIQLLCLIVLVHLYLTSCPLITFNPAPFPSGLTLLYLNGTSITAFAPTTTNNIDLRYMLMGATGMNNALQFIIDSKTFNAGVKSLDTRGYGAPTGAGATVKTSL